MAFDEKIFDDKTLSDMFADVYRNTDRKRGQIEEFVKHYMKFITTPEDAAVLGPIISNFLEVNVKNDEHIVRLVQIAQRLVSVNSKSQGGDFLLTEEEKRELLKNVKIDFETVVAEQGELQDKIDRLAV